MRCRLLIALAAGEKDDASEACWNGRVQNAESRFGNFFNTRLFSTLLTGNDHARLQYRSFHRDILALEFLEHLLERLFSRLVALLERVVAVYQNLRLDHWNDVGLLTKRGITGE